MNLFVVNSYTDTLCVLVAAFSVAVWFQFTVFAP